MNTAYVIAVITSLGCGVNVLCLRAIEADSTGQRAQTYPTPNDCVGALIPIPDHSELMMYGNDVMDLTSLRLFSKRSAPSSSLSQTSSMDLHA